VRRFLRLAMEFLVLLILAAIVPIANELFWRTPIWRTLALIAVEWRSAAPILAR